MKQDIVSYYQILCVEIPSKSLSDQLSDALAHPFARGGHFRTTVQRLHDAVLERSSLDEESTDTKVRMGIAGKYPLGRIKA